MTPSDPGSKLSDHSKQIDKYNLQFLAAQFFFHNWKYLSKIKKYFQTNPDPKCV